MGDLPKSLLVQYAVDVPEEGVGPDIDSVR